MATVTGQMTTTNVLSDQLALDFGDQIALLDAEVAPVLTIFSRMANKNATVAKNFSWFEDQQKARFFTQNGGATSGATTVAVSTGQGAGFQQWDIVKNTRTGENIRVDGVAGDNLTVTRGIGSTAAAMLNGDELYLIGTAQPEGDTSKPSRSDVPSKVTNNTQIFRTPLEISGTALNVGYQIQPNEWDRQNQRKTAEHNKDIELAFLFGTKSATTPGSTEDRTTGGALSFITTNQTDAGGDLSEAEWNAFMLQVSRYATGRMLVLASGVGVSALTKFPASKQLVRSDETTYGMNVNQFTNPYGPTFNVVYHRMLEGTKYAGYMIALDMDQVSYRYIQNRDTHLRQNIQPPDLDGRKDELLSECGLQFGLQRRHGVLTGITS